MLNLIGVLLTRIFLEKMMPESLVMMPDDMLFGFYQVFTEFHDVLDNSSYLK